MARTPRAVFAGVLLPAIILAVRGTNAAGQAGQGSDLLAGLAVLGVVSASYVTHAMSLVLARESGVLRRWRLSPLPGWCLFAGKTLATLVLAAGCALGTVLVAALMGISCSPNRVAMMIGLILIGVLCWATVATAVSSLIPDRQCRLPLADAHLPSRRAAVRRGGPARRSSRVAAYGHQPAPSALGAGRRRRRAQRRAPEHLASRGGRPGGLDRCGGAGRRPAVSVDTPGRCDHAPCTHGMPRLPPERRAVLEEQWCGLSPSRATTILTSGTGDSACRPASERRRWGVCSTPAREVTPSLPLCRALSVDRVTELILAEFGAMPPAGLSDEGSCHGSSERIGCEEQAAQCARFHGVGCSVAVSVEGLRQRCRGGRGVA